jgi:hypothetical protein
MSIIQRHIQQSVFCSVFSNIHKYKINRLTQPSNKQLLLTIFYTILKKIVIFLRFVDRASRYMRVMKPT